MKRTVLICRSNPIDPDPRVEKIARTLSSDGYEISIVGWDRTGILPKVEKNSKFKVERLSIRANYGQGLGNLPQLIRWQLGLLFYLIRHLSSFQIIHACDFDTILPSFLVARLFHKKIVYDIFDFYADHLRKTPKWIKRIIKAIDLFMISRTDGVIIVDDSRKRQISGAIPRRLAVIYNSPEEMNYEFREINHESNIRLRIAYTGLLQKERGIIEFLTLLNAHPEWHLDLAGFGGDEDKIFCLSKNMVNVIWYGRINYKKALELTHNADILFATYDPSIENHKYSSPNKIFEAMMFGKPIIVAKETNMDRIILEENCGLDVKYGNIESLEKALISLENPEFRKILGKNAREAYIKKYGWHIMQRRLSVFYNEIVS